MQSRIAFLYPILALSCATVNKEGRTIKGEDNRNAPTFSVDNVQGTFTASAGHPIQVEQTQYVVLKATVSLQVGNLTRTILLTTAPFSSSSQLVYTLSQTATYSIGYGIDKQHIALNIAGLKTLATPAMALAAADFGSVCSIGLPVGQATDVSGTSCNSLAFTRGLQINAIAGRSDGSQLVFAQCIAGTCNDDGFTYRAGTNQ